MDEEKIISAKEVARFLNITEGTVYRLAKLGKLPAVRIGNQWRFDMGKIRELFEAGTEFHDEEEETTAGGKKDKISRQGDQVSLQGQELNKGNNR